MRCSEASPTHDNITARANENPAKIISNAALFDPVSFTAAPI